MPLNLYRKRLIPEECLLLKDDVIVKQNEDVIVTRWQTLNPKTAFQSGASCYFLKEGFKVSKFYRSDGSLYCWYCDIVRFDFTAPDDLIVTDLLADVVIMPDGVVKVLDLDELAEAHDKRLLTTDMLKASLYCLNRLLSIIYSNRFHTLQKELDSLGL